MTVEQWRALPEQERRATWQALNPEQRRQLTIDLFASTPVWGLPYPSNYEDPADSPTAFQQLAEAVEMAVSAAHVAHEGKYVPSPDAVTTTDWNLATGSGFHATDNTAANIPNADAAGWLGMVSRIPDGCVQIAWPIGGGTVPRGAAFQRTYTSGTWGGWARLANWTFSWGTGDNFIGHQHGPAGVSRFAVGMKKDAATAVPSNLDAWRVQCYDLAGQYLWTAIQVPESGVVTFPKGHSLLAERIASGEPISADTVLTVGALAALLERAGVDVGLNLAAPDEPAPPEED